MVDQQSMLSDLAAQARPHFLCRASRGQRYADQTERAGREKNAGEPCWRM